MRDLISGALIAGYALAGLFFLRFWRESRDRLFAIFAAAFWLLAVQRTFLSLTGLSAQGTGAAGATWIYGLRLLAYVLILAAIIDKNRGAARARRGEG